jgi:RNA recognition motif-containing protein
VLGSELKVTWNVQAAGPKEDTSGHPTVFVGNIGDSIDEYTLFEAFSQFNCSDSRIIRGEDGRCLGYGFVTIRTQEDAQAAVTAMDGQRLMGRPLRVSFAKTPRLSETTGTAASESTSRSRPPDTSQPLDPDVVAGQASETNNTVHVGNLLGEVALDWFTRCMRQIGSIDHLSTRRARA